MSEILIFKTEDNQTEINVQFENETVWKNSACRTYHLGQLTILFERDRTVITKHINNIFREGELDEKSNVQKMHIANSDKPVNYYNLDVIISLGYRVNSKRGTQFRQWATQRLKDYLTQGYAVNTKRLEQLQQTIELITRNAENLQLNEAKGLLDILGKYAKSFSILNQYDGNQLSTDWLNDQITYEIKYDEAKNAITELKKQLIAQKQASELFGNEKDDSFSGILKSVVQTFGGQYLYASIEEQASNLLYFVIKNHPFSDGNKRIGAFLFVWFLEKNKHRLKHDGEPKINDNGLTVLALLVAQSNPMEKELMIKLVINLINGKV